MSEPYQVFLCLSCACRRRIYHRLGGKGLLHLWVCSQGHHWTTPVTLLEKMVDISREACLQELKRSMFGDNAFLRELRRRG